MGATVQGEFETEEAAQRAIQALRKAGFKAEHIREWNIIPEAPPEPPAKGTSPVAKGAAVGFVVGGVAGAGLGAAYGAVYAGATAPEHHIPLPKGVRLVVDLAGAPADAAEILRQHGAVNVH